MPVSGDSHGAGLMSERNPPELPERPSRGFSSLANHFGAGLVGVGAAYLSWRCLRRREENRFLRDLVTEVDADLVPPTIPDLPERIDDEDGFYLVLATARASLPYVGAAAEAALPDDVEPLVRGVISAHMARLYKLFDSILTLVQARQWSAAAVLTRSLVEIVINLDFLVTSPDRSTIGLRCRGFVCRSALQLQQPLPYFEDRVVAPENRESPTDEQLKAFIDSVRPVVRINGDVNYMLIKAGLIDTATTEGHSSRIELVTSSMLGPRRCGVAHQPTWPSGCTSTGLPNTRWQRIQTGRCSTNTTSALGMARPC